MKKFILSLTLCFVTFLCVSQETYKIDDTSYYLIKETDGTIILLWNVIKGKARYFIKTDDTLTELVNTKDENGKRKFEYKTLLADLTSDEQLPVENVKLKLLSLKAFIDDYNTLKDSDYIATKKGELLTRLSLFGGLSNSPFLDNLDNIKNPVFGFEFEFSESFELPRHSIYFQGKQVLSSDDFDYSATQLNIGYRFRIINKQRFTFYTSIDMARYAFIKTKNSDIKENGFDAPFIFNLGTDIRLTDTSFITFAYDELFSLLLEEQTHFPVSFTVGYKFNL